jgi:hypothetical protein
MNAPSLIRQRAAELLAELAYNRDVECDYDGKRQKFGPLLTRFVLEAITDRDMQAVVECAVKDDAHETHDKLMREIKIQAEVIAEGELPDPYQREVERRQAAAVDAEIEARKYQEVM